METFPQSPVHLVPTTPQIVHPRKRYSELEGDAEVPDILLSPASMFNDEAAAATSYHRLRHLSEIEIEPQRRVISTDFSPGEQFMSSQDIRANLPNQSFSLYATGTRGQLSGHAEQNVPPLASTPDIVAHRLPAEPSVSASASATSRHVSRDVTNNCRRCDVSELNRGQRVESGARSHLRNKLRLRSCRSARADAAAAAAFSGRSPEARDDGCGGRSGASRGTERSCRDFLDLIDIEH